MSDLKGKRVTSDQDLTGNRYTPSRPCDASASEAMFRWTMDKLRVIDTQLAIQLNSSAAGIARDTLSTGLIASSQLDVIKSATSRFAKTLNPVDAVSAISAVGATSIALAGRYGQVYFGGNLYSPENRSDDAPATSIAAAFEKTVNATTPQLFQTSDAFAQERASLSRPMPTREGRFSRSSAMHTTVNGLMAAVCPDDVREGIVRTEKGGDPILDKSVELPLSFTDLRRSGSTLLRSVYFRPFNLQLSETLSPEFDQQTFYGRSDPVMFYRGTTRTFSISFELHTFCPQDLDVIHKKLHWLKSMVYPEYGGDALLKAGPVVRLRLGDLIKGTGFGLPGVITGLDIDYNDALWELADGYVLPRKAGVSVSFTALHDAAVGVVGGRFGLFDPKKLTSIYSSNRTFGGTSTTTNVSSAFVKDGFGAREPDTVAIVTPGQRKS